MNFVVGNLYWFKKYQWKAVEVFNGGGTPAISTVTLQLVSKPWFLLTGGVPQEVVIGKTRFDEITPVTGK